jgi:addiction module RelE/StbE family toxin
VKIVWTKRALEHLQSLHDYIAEDSKWNAALVAKRILEAVELLEKQPELGRVGRRLGTRELVIPKTPFVVIYRVRGGALRLLAVLHGKQIW